MDSDDWSLHTNGTASESLAGYDQRESKKWAISLRVGEWWRQTVILTYLLYWIISMQTGNLHSGDTH